MAKLATALEALAPELGVSVGHADRLARVGKKHGTIPLSPIGGGSRAVHMGADPLIFLALGVAVADPLTAAPAFVALYRDMVHLPPQPQRPIQNEIDRVLFPDEPWRPQPRASFMAFPDKPDGLYTLAEMVSRLLMTLAGRDGLEFERAFASSNFELMLQHGTPHPSADVSYLSGGKMQREQFVPFKQAAAVEGAITATGLLRTVSLRSSLLITMGRLLRDTQSHYENPQHTGE